MPEENGGAGASQADTTQGQQTDAGATTTQTTTATTESTEKPRTDTANRRIKEFASQRGITVEALLDQFTQLEEAGQTELEKRDKALRAAEERAAKLDAEIRTERTERMVLSAATKANAKDPDAILALASRRIEYDDDGRPTNVDAVIKALRDERPDRFAAAGGNLDGGNRGSSTETSNFNKVLREMARTAH
jgi:hypothetical protein